MDHPLFQTGPVESKRVLYTPSAFAKDALLHLQEIGELTALRPHVSKRAGLNSFLFFIVVSGRGTVQYESKQIHLEEGQCVFLDCSRPYCHIADPDQLWSLQWIHFYGNTMTSIYEKYQSRGGNWHFSTRQGQQYRALLHTLYGVAEGSDPIRDMKIAETIGRLLTMLMDETVWSNPNPVLPSAAKNKLTDIRKYIDTHFTENPSLDRISELFYINKYYLARIFKEQFGVSVNSYLISCRVTYAKQLLRFTGGSIEAIARQCGIEDAAYFTRMFRKVEGVTPGEFRRNWTA